MQPSHLPRDNSLVYPSDQQIDQDDVQQQQSPENAILFVTEELVRISDPVKFLQLAFQDHVPETPHPFKIEPLFLVEQDRLIPINRTDQQEEDQQSQSGPIQSTEKESVTSDVSQPPTSRVSTERPHSVTTESPLHDCRLSTGSRDLADDDEWQPSEENDDQDVEDDDQQAVSECKSESRFKSIPVDDSRCPNDNEVSTITSAIPEPCSGPNDGDNNGRKSTRGILRRIKQFVKDQWARTARSNLGFLSCVRRNGSSDAMASASR